jgi:hypothetical protein
MPCRENLAWLFFFLVVEIMLNENQRKLAESTMFLSEESISLRGLNFGIDKTLRKKLDAAKTKGDYNKIIKTCDKTITSANKYRQSTGEQSINGLVTELKKIRQLAVSKKSKLEK